MPKVVKGRNVKVEIATAFAAAKIVTAITKADPAVATSTAHGLANGVVGYLSGVEGMVQLEGQAIRVANQTANTLELAGLNTSNFSDFSGQTDLITASTWLTYAESTSYQINGGAAEKLDVTTLADVVKKEENGLLAAQSVDIGVLAMTSPTAAAAKIESAAQAGISLLWRITLEDGSQRIFYGEPSLPGENVQKGQVGSGSLSVSVKGYVLKLAPVA